ncbi:MAG: hypothetical protein KGS72_21765 [Cyanobacteria bacterium REEB67]|nr:hypothetical protein [Cyanobacteria bacterium REEB67]
MTADKPEGDRNITPTDVGALKVDLSIRHELSSPPRSTQSNLEHQGLLPHLAPPEAAIPAKDSAPPTEKKLLALVNEQFDKMLKTMSSENHHWNTFPWLQNLSEDRKCYSQANEMGQALRSWIDRTPGMKDNFTVQEGTINEGKGNDPRDFYTGNAEHNFVVITDLKTGSKYYGDPWSGLKFSRNPEASVHNYKGQKIWEHEF